MVRLPRIGGDGGTVYRSERGERRVKQQYRGMLDELPVERRWVETRHGVTHVLTAGDPTDPPLFIFHGGNAINPVTLPWVLPLADDYRVLAPDTPGHPGFSTPTRLSPYEHDFADWVGDLLDAFAVDTARMVGVSYGAGIVLRTATYAPARIDRAALVAPAGLGQASTVQVMRGLVWPFVRYRLIPSRANFEAVLAVLCTEPIDELDDEVVAALRAVFDHVDVDRRLPPAATAEELAGFTAPTLVAAGTDDVLFPASVVFERARAVIPALETCIRLEGEHHLPSAAAISTVRRYLRAFLADE